MTDSPTPRALPCGTWPSPITAAEVAQHERRVSYPLGMDGEVWWQEVLPGEQGRTTLMRLGTDGRRLALLPAPWSARSRVHEYGGRSYLPVPAVAGPDQEAGDGERHWALVFANDVDQRLYLVDEPGPDGADATPTPLTPAPLQDPGATSLRFADFVLSPDGAEVWCVQERHEDAKVTRAIVAVPLDGSAAEDDEAIRQLVTGSDFYAFPTPSPDGSRLAWISWNHPRMPWDGTELRVAAVEDGVPGKGWLLKGGISESVLAPLWRDEASLYVISDWPGFWNIYQLSLSGPAEAVYPAEEEFAGPLWQLGSCPYALLSDGRLAVLHGTGGMRLGLLDPGTGELADLDIPYRVFAPALSADGISVVGVAGGSSTALSVIRVDAETGKAKKLYSASGRLPASGYLPKPRKMHFEGKFGQTVHAWVYAPANPDAVVPEGERPPYVVWVHGGPASHADRLLDLEKAYFTSRGIGIIDVNYGGSTGYGRAYRERLRRQWGVVDVEDVIAAAQALVEVGEADGARLAIRGGSAGGWTALAAVTTYGSESRIFKAATAYFGVTDLQAFAANTHDFESHYLDSLVGPLPGFKALYAERSPLGHVTPDTSPVLLLQGLDDKIVPPAQSRSIAEELATHGIRYGLLEFEGESHGFRRAETITAALESELSFYAQVLSFTPPDIPPLDLIDSQHTPTPEPPPAPTPVEPGQGADLPIPREQANAEQPSRA